MDHLLYLKNYFRYGRLKRVYEMDNISQEKADQKCILYKALFWANYGEHLSPYHILWGIRNWFSAGLAR